MKNCRLFILMGDRRVCALYIIIHACKSDTYRHSRCDPHCMKFEWFLPCLLLWWQENIRCFSFTGVVDGSAVEVWLWTCDGLLTALEGESFSPWTKVRNLHEMPSKKKHLSFHGLQVCCHESKKKHLPVPASPTWNLLKFWFINDKVRFLRQSDISWVEDDGTFSSGVTSRNIRLVTRMNPLMNTKAFRLGMAPVPPAWRAGFSSNV